MALTDFKRSVVLGPKFRKERARRPELTTLSRNPCMTQRLDGFAHTPHGSLLRGLFLGLMKCEGPFMDNFGEAV